jgi:hypothetical protein
MREGYRPDHTAMALERLEAGAAAYISQIRTILSPAEASRVESCEKATELTELLWPLSVWRQALLLVSQIRTVLSCDAEASRVESCEKATEWTTLLWPSSV